MISSSCDPRVTLVFLINIFIAFAWLEGAESFKNNSCTNYDQRQISIGTWIKTNSTEADYTKQKIIRRVEVLRPIWISDVLSKKLSNYRPTSKTNHLCNQQSDLYEENLQRLSLWAVQMRESSAASTEGMLVGKSFQLGHYDECMEVRSSAVAGRYCLANIQFAPSGQLRPHFYARQLNGRIAPPESDAWDTIKKSNTPVRADRDKIQWGLCVPAACSWKDVEESLAETFASALDEYSIQINVSLTERSCSSTIDEKPLPTATKFMIYLVVFLSALSILTTCYHSVALNFDEPPSTLKSEGSLSHVIIMSFSLVNSFRSLTHRTADNLSVFDGLKFFTTVYMIICHRVGISLGGMIFNPRFIETRMEDGQMIQIKSTIVDTFFAITGFLVFYFGYKASKTHGLKTVIALYITRWIRLMPAYMMVLALIVNVVPYSAEGPQWKSAIYQAADNCKLNWWTNFLGINNLIGTDNTCTVHGWYLACDLQLLAVAGLLSYVFSRNHTLGLISTLATLIASILVPFYNIYSSGYTGIVRMHWDFLRDPANDVAMKSFYIQSYNRAGPYIIGMLSCYLVMMIRQNNWKLGMAKRWLILLGTTALGVGYQFFGFILADPHREYHPLPHALWGSTHRSIWGIWMMSVAVIQLGWGFGKTLDLVLTHEVLTPLSRLTYMVYLIHPVWQMMIVFHNRAPQFLSILNFFQLCFGDILMSYCLGLWLYCILDRPFGRISNLLLAKVSKIILGSAKKDD